MKALVQRVSKASVNINNKCVSNIQEGVCVFLGIREDDSSEDVMYLVNKITKLYPSVLGSKFVLNRQK